MSFSGVKVTPVEIDSLNGEVAKIGLSYNVKTPLNNALFNMVKAIESGY